MKRAEHARSCEAAFGKPFTEVHDFLDKYSQVFPREHRMLYHHRRGVELIAEKFGPEAVKAAERHILEDGGPVPEDHTCYRTDNEELLRIVRQTYPRSGERGSG